MTKLAMQNIDPTNLLVNIAKVLDDLGIQYFVTGGMAVFVWGRPRFTADVDIVIALKSENSIKLIRALRAFGKSGYIDEDAVEEALRNKSEFNFIDGITGVKVDFWVLRDRDVFEQLRFKRRVGRKILDYMVYFISPEDLILSKLIWHQKSESTRHMEDAESVLKVSDKKLDFKYLKKRAKELGVSEILTKIRS